MPIMEPLRLDRIEHEDGITVVTTEIVVSDDDGSITITDMGNSNQIVFSWGQFNDLHRWIHRYDRALSSFERRRLGCSMDTWRAIRRSAR